MKKPGKKIYSQTKPEKKNQAGLKNLDDTKYQIN